MLIAGLLTVPRALQDLSKFLGGVWLGMGSETPGESGRGDVEGFRPCGPGLHAAVLCLAHSPWAPWSEVMFTCEELKTPQSVPGKLHCQEDASL